MSNRLKSYLKHAILMWQMLCAASLFGQIPTAPAPNPSCPSTDVISLFSDVYSNVPVNTWLTPWSSPGSSLSNIQVAGNDVKCYGNVGFFGIETLGANLIDASAMTSFHLDFWTPNMTTVRVKLVDFGADGNFGGGDDREHEITISNPTLNTWKSYSILMTDFPTLTSTSHIAQIILSGEPYGFGTLYVDNMYFSTCSNPLFPSVGAPDPTWPAPQVISMYSGVYADVSVNTWLAPWSLAPAALNDIVVAGNNTKCYSGVTFLGIETTGANLIDASMMNQIHFNIWTPNMTTFRIKLVDFGPNGFFGGGDDSEHEFIIDNFVQAEWRTFGILLSSFTNLNSTSQIAQVILSGYPAGTGRFYLDNLYFSTNNVPLPVTWTSFDASPKVNGSVLLEWSTSAEINSDRFEIQRSSDAVRFEVIGQVQASGFSSTLRDYSYVDEQFSAQEAYYRLKQYDFDGAYSFSEVRYVRKESSGDELSMYPNPASSEFILSLHQNAKVEYWLLDSQGRSVKQGHTDEHGRARVPLGDVGAGRYSLWLNTDGRIISRQLIVSE